MLTHYVNNWSAVKGGTFASKDQFSCVITGTVTDRTLRFKKVNCSYSCRTFNNNTKVLDYIVLYSRNRHESKNMGNVQNYEDTL